MNYETYGAARKGSPYRPVKQHRPIPGQLLVLVALLQFAVWVGVTLI